MHCVWVDEWSPIAEVTFHKPLLNSPAGGWFPAMQMLTLCITASNLPYTELFFSRGLEEESIFAIWSLDNPSHDVLSAIASVISAIPTSAL